MLYFNRAIADIRHLVEKYPDGLDSYDGPRPDGACGMSESDSVDEEANYMDCHVLGQSSESSRPLQVVQAT